MTFFRNKRGAIEFPMQELVVLVLVGIIIAVVAIYVLPPLVGILFGGGEKQASLDSLATLRLEVQKLLSDGKNYSKAEVPFFMAEDYFLVGFDAFATSSQSWCISKDVPLGKIYAPKKCLGACICLFKSISAEQKYKDEGVLDCETFSGNIKIYTTQRASVSGQLFVGGNRDDIKWGAPAYLSLRGTACPPVPIGPTKYWRQKNLYIDKYVDSDGTVYIYINEASDSTSQRYADWKTALKV